jgi:hypothetical protein
METGLRSRLVFHCGDRQSVSNVTSVGNSRFIRVIRVIRGFLRNIFALIRGFGLGLVISPAGEVTVMVERPGGIDHRVEVSSDLQHWTASTNLSATGSVATWIDPGPAIFRSRFYRAVQR